MPICFCNLINVILLAMSDAVASITSLKQNCLDINTVSISFVRMLTLSVQTLLVYLLVVTKQLPLWFVNENILKLL